MTYFQNILRPQGTNFKLQYSTGFLKTDKGFFLENQSKKKL